MLIQATQKYTRQTPSKIRLIAHTLKGLSISNAIKKLAGIEKKSTIVLMKVIRQAVANATHNYNLSIDDLIIKSILINEGPMYKRWQAVSRGRAHSILKKTSHVKIILETKGDKKVAARKEKIAEPVKKDEKVLNQELKQVGQAQKSMPALKEIKPRNETKDIRTIVHRKQIDKGT